MKSSVLALKPVYVDTFRNGINTKVWNVWGAQHDDYVKYDRGVIRGKQVSVRNNELVVAMSKRSSPRTFSGDTTQRWWDTGWISTKPAYGFTYGAYEVEAILPAAANISGGVWSGIWSRPFSGASGGEIDPAEAFGHIGDQARESRAEGFTSSIHFTQNRALAKSNLQYKHSGKHSPKTDTPLSTHFHTYGMFKSDQEIIIYLDRKEIHRITRADRPKAWGAAYPARTPFDLRICLQAGGNWGGYPTSRTAQRSELRVRKVTVWNFETTPLAGVAYRG